MRIQDSHWQDALASDSGNGRLATVGGTGVDGPSAAGVATTARALSAASLTGEGGRGGRSAPLRVDAQRNLEHVLRAAREVFGELGYGAPMEDVARRAKVGVGTVYRRFPSKDVLVRRIAEEETSRLTEQARTALGQEKEPWSALSHFLRASVVSGAGRLLPPQVLRVGVDDEASAPGRRPGPGSASASASAVLAGSGVSVGVDADVDGIGTGSRAAFGRGTGSGTGAESGPVTGSGPVEVLEGVRVPQQRQGTGQPDLRGGTPRSIPEAEGAEETAAGLGGDDTGGAAELLQVVGLLVDRARGAGELRGDVTVADVLLVIATAAPALPDAAQQAAASARLLEILLEGLRPHAA
ncbi:TetR/AcrR family transcriptional regulator [Streptomyces sp. DT171]|uniref:TetR/AcrR family transcriptional regulator n=1 Tax=Streptomyces sp. DT171 TaxID=3416524 RepID=UPI003CF5F0E6